MQNLALPLPWVRTKWEELGKDQHGTRKPHLIQPALFATKRRPPKQIFQRPPVSDHERSVSARMMNRLQRQKQTIGVSVQDTLGKVTGFVDRKGSLAL